MAAIQKYVFRLFLLAFTALLLFSFASANEEKKFREIYSGEGIADYAKTMLGISYIWGGDTICGFDCSGLTMYVYGQIGRNFGHGCNM